MSWSGYSRPQKKHTKTMADKMAVEKYIQMGL